MPILTDTSQPAIQKLQAGKEQARAEVAGLFLAGLTAQAEFSEVDELTSSINDWDYRVAQLSSGPFCGSLSLAQTSSLQVYRSAWNPALLVQGSVPRRSVVFGAQCGGAPGAMWRGKEVAMGDILVVRSHQENDLQTRGDCDTLVMTMDADLFAEHAEILRGDSAIIGSDTWSLRNHMTTRRLPLLQNWLQLLQQVLGLGIQLRDSQIAAQAEAKLAEMILLNIGSPLPEARLAERRRVALRAREHMLSKIGEPLTIKDICQAVRTTERTLHLGFQEAFGLTPKRFLKTLRLNSVRRSLQSAPLKQTVTNVACQWGFFHFSNFAADYYQQFGELPSETLQRRLQMSA